MSPLSHSLLEFFLSSCLSYSHVFTEIGPRSKAGKTSTEKIGTSRGTLRLRSKGPATVEELVCYVHLIPILVGNIQLCTFIRAGNKAKVIPVSKRRWLGAEHML